jgi:hypothetical protein
MEGIDLLEKAYEEFESPSYRCCIKFCAFGGCFCQKTRKRVKMREFDGAWPSLESAILPDNINW